MYGTWTKALIAAGPHAAVGRSRVTTSTTTESRAATHNRPHSARKRSSLRLARRFHPTWIAAAASARMVATIIYAGPRAQRAPPRMGSRFAQDVEGE